MLRSLWTNGPKACASTVVSIGALAYSVAAGPTTFLSISLPQQLPNKFDPGRMASFGSPKSVVPSCADLPWA